MSEEMKNAATEELPRKRGYYSSVLKGQMLIDYETALAMEGLENEIALLRAEIMSLARDGIFVVNMLIAAYNCLKGLVKVQKTVFKKDQSLVLEDCLQNVFQKLALDNGIPLETLMKNPLAHQGLPA